MKHCKKLIILMGVCLGFLPTSCQSNDVEYETEFAEIDASEYGLVEVPIQTITIDIRRDVPSVLPIRPAPPSSNAPQAAFDTPVRPDPMVYAQSIFNDNIDVPPWRANYVGSYGMLPSRVNEPPFLYSFDISPDSDIFTDGQYGPVSDEREFFWRDNDDDDLDN